MPFGVLVDGQDWPSRRSFLPSLRQAKAYCPVDVTLSIRYSLALGAFLDATGSGYDDQKVVRLCLSCAATSQTVSHQTVVSRWTARS